MNPLLSSGSILKEPRSWFLKTPSFPADEGVFPWEKESGGWRGGCQLFAFSPAWQEGMKKTVEKVHCFFISACLSIRRGSRRGIRLPGP